MIERLLRDVRHALRRLRRRPAFAVSTVSILALGLGSTAAVASIGDALLLQALPYPDGERLVSLYEANPGQGMTDVYTSLPIVNDWMEGTDAFAEIGVNYTPASVVLGGDGEPERLSASLVSPAFFRALGVQPALGRFFRDSENRIPGGHALAILSHDLWQTHFGADPEIIGESLLLNGQPYTVIGVAPARFADFPHPAQRTDLWIPVMMTDEIIGNNIIDNRQARSLAVIARLRDGVGVDAARLELETVGARLAAEYPAISSGWMPRIRTVHAEYSGDFRAPVIVLVVGAAFLLLIGAANVANLVLLRAAESRHEIAMRVALGASRPALAYQFVTEGLIVAGAGGTIGIAAAAAATRAVAGLSPIDFPSYVDFGLRGGVLVGALLVTLATGLLIGLAPFLQVGLRPRWAQVAGERRSASTAAARLRRGLVVAEVAIAAVLLIGAGLTMRSFARLSRSDVGFRTDRLLAAQLHVSSELYDDDVLDVLAQELLEESNGIAGAERVDLWSPHVPGQAFWYTRVRPQDRPDLSDDELVSVRFHYVGPGALEGLGLRFVAGRGIERRDRAGAPHVVVLSASLAETLWPGQDPIGKVLKRWNRDAWATVVGVVEDARQGGLQGPGSEFTRDIYFSFMQEPQRDWVLLARGAADAASLAGPLRAAVTTVVPEIPAFDARTMDERFAELAGVPRFTALIATLYAGFAVLLATIGLYSVLAYSVCQRCREIGLRMALGARASRVLREVVAGGLRWTIAGLAIGVVAAGGLSRLMSSVLFEISPTDPLTFIAIPLSLLAVAALACLAPARRATRIDPMRALRAD